jgi:hypothetical protein
MTKQSRKDDLQTMLRDPAAVFSTPRDVLDRPGLTRDERLAILRQWERDARGLSVAEEEGMGGGEESLLSARQTGDRAIGRSRVAGRLGYEARLAQPHPSGRGGSVRVTARLTLSGWRDSGQHSSSAGAASA